MNDSAKLEARFGARNYAPLPVTLVRGEGVYVWDDGGQRYLDLMGAYSAVSFGHCHPRLVRLLYSCPGDSAKSDRRLLNQPVDHQREGQDDRIPAYTDNELD